MKGLLLTLLLSSNLANAKVSDSFIIELFDKKVSVVSPKNKKNPVPIIIKNNSLSRVVGRVEVGNYRADIFAIEPTESHDLRVTVGDGQKAVFIPISPAFESVDLIFGNKSYEIPEKK